MAILRSEIQANQSNGDDPRSTYDCYAEALEDLNKANTAHMAVGSMAYVREENKDFIKTNDESWITAKPEEEGA